MSWFYAYGGGPGKRLALLVQLQAAGSFRRATELLLPSLNSLLMRLTAARWR